MANIATLFKEEITRLARKEIRSETEGFKKASAQYRSDIAALKRRVSALEKQLSFLEKKTRKNDEVKVASDGDTKFRFTVKGFKSLRQRLGLTAAEIGTLLDTTAPTIYNWEAGNSTPREPQLLKLVKLRGLGKREVAVMLSTPAEEISK